MKGSHSQTTPVKKMSSASLTGLDKTPFENTPHLSQPEHSVSPRSRPLSSDPNSSPRKSLDSAVGSSGSSAGGSGGGGGGHTIQQVCPQLLTISYFCLLVCQHFNKAKFLGSAYRKPAFQPSAFRRLFIGFQPSAENQPPWKKFKYGINYMIW